MDKKTGIILNNQMNDFSSPGIPNAFGYDPSPINYIQPGKRPLSSSSPVIVEIQSSVPNVSSQIRFGLGCSGGSRIPSCTLNSLLNILEFESGLAQGIDHSRIHHQLIPHQVELEFGGSKMFKIFESLQDKGHVVVWKGRGYGGSVSSAYGVEVIYEKGQSPRVVAVSDSRNMGLSAAW